MISDRGWRHLGVGGLIDPAVQRLPGRLFERAAALAFPEDRDHEGGEERARYRDQQDPARRRGCGEDHSAEEDAGPGAKVADAVGPAAQAVRTNMKSAL
jgi:hypothetical protein